MAAVTGGLKAMLESKGGAGGGAEQQQQQAYGQEQNGGGGFAPPSTAGGAPPLHHQLHASAPVAIGAAAAVRARAAPIAIPGTAPNGES